jgi:hypothetical protein
LVRNRTCAIHQLNNPRIEVKKKVDPPQPTKEIVSLPTEEIDSQHNKPPEAYNSMNVTSSTKDEQRLTESALTQQAGIYGEGVAEAKKANAFSNSEGGKRSISRRKYRKTNISRKSFRQKQK